MEPFVRDEELAALEEQPLEERIEFLEQLERTLRDSLEDDDRRS